MDAVDTNILVRLLTRDHPQQYAKALALFERAELFVPDTVILECEWVLRYGYSFTPVAICVAFRRLFGLPNVHLEDPERVARAIQWHEQGLDFADALHLPLPNHGAPFHLRCQVDSQSQGNERMYGHPSLNNWNNWGLTPIL